MEELFWRGAESVAGAISGFAAGSLLGTSANSETP
jgi:hypothetical protein